ncbi:hypothetical protein Hanom_Chr01g00002771 [Helianthus anomalus]
MSEAPEMFSGMTEVEEHETEDTQDEDDVMFDSRSKFTSSETHESMDEVHCVIYV